MSRAACPILANLGAEEGADWPAPPEPAQLRVAKALFSHLFSRTAVLRSPESGAGSTWSSLPCESLWPAALGPAPDAPVFPWLEVDGRATAWLNTPSLESNVQDALGMDLAGPRADRVALVHDKAFAVRTARELGLVADSIAPLIEILDATELADSEAVVDRLSLAMSRWPDWLEGSYTLKPRIGTSGRGRVGGRHELDREAVRGALPRLAKRGGAIFEPWLSRRTDHSVTLHVPPSADADTLPSVLGSLEMLANPSGVFRGHCGEVDSRGRVHSGLPDDETLRVDAVRVAERARGLGFFGPCGVDAFSHFEPDRPADRECWRGCVEFNARATMGLVTIGLVRRALAGLREASGLEPGMRWAFAMVVLGPDAIAVRPRLIEASGSQARAIDLSSDPSARAQPLLLFAPDRVRLRQALRDVLSC